MDLSRRSFGKISLGVGAALALRPAFAAVQPALEPDSENELRKAARHTMSFASPYASADWQSNPHMHYQFKKNIQEMSDGAIYVELLDKGVAGIGTELMAQVYRGLVSAALVSVSNLSPAAPELDILNIPFWSSGNQEFVNLVTSGVWNEMIMEKILREQRIRVLFFHVPGPRTVTSIRSFGEVIKTPEDMEDVLFRVPASRALRIFYELAGAKPIKIEWKSAARLARHERYQGLDPCVVGLYNGPDNLRLEIGAISEIESVADGWSVVISQEWFSTLSPDMQEIILAAAEQTFRDHLEVSAQAVAYCRTQFERFGVEIYQPDPEERAQWVERCGPMHPAWDELKDEILGDRKRFQQLMEATQVNNGFTFQEVTGPG